jgi:hypothetical protein
MSKIIKFELFMVASDGKPPLGYQKIPCHMIFDVKFDGRRKARFVAGGHLTLDPKEDAYAGVVTPEAIRLAMFAAVHNDLKVLAADIGNVYLHAKTKEKLHTVLGEEYGTLEGKVLVFNKGLYGLRSSGARFHEHLSDILKKLGFIPSKANLDLWFTHYECITRYVDDILFFSKDPTSILECLKITYPLQGVGVPEYYLGGDLKIHKKKDGSETFVLSAKTYLQNVCEKIESIMDIKLKSYETPMAHDDHPENDVSGLLNHDEHSKYCMLIGCGQWAITLGCFDVMYAIQTMARFSAAPKEGHLQRMLRAFGHLKHYTQYGIMVDTGKKGYSTL